MFGFTSKAPPIRTMKAYSILDADGQEKIDRPRLVEVLIEVCRNIFGKTPADYDIYGPYGIPKGKTIGQQAFLKRLQDKGHDKYTGYTASVPNEFGFTCSFYSRSDTSSCAFVELVFWYGASQFAVDLPHLTKIIANAFPINYGYVLDLPDNYDVMMEMPIKKGIFGTSVSTNSKQYKWHQSVGRITEGGVRDLYRYNLLNPSQVDALGKMGIVGAVEVVSGISVLELTDDSLFKNARKRYADSGKL